MFKKIILLTIILGLQLQTGATQNRLTPEKLWEFDQVSSQQLSPVGDRMVYLVTEYSLSENKGNREVYLYNFNDESTELLLEQEWMAYGLQWRPDGKKVGFMSPKSGSAQFFEIDLESKSVRQVTDFESSIGNTKYSPGMKYISFTKKVKIDETLKDKHADLPLATALAYDELMYRHWDSWHDHQFEHVFYVAYEENKSIKNGETDIMSGQRFHSPVPPFGGEQDIIWSNDDQNIVYVSKKLEGKAAAKSTNTDIYSYSIEKQNTTNLTEGKMGYDNYPQFSPDGKMIAWLSMERDGFESDKKVLHILDWTNTSKPAISLSDSFEESISGFRWLPESNGFYFYADTKGTVQLYQLNLSSAIFGEIKVPKEDNFKQISNGTHNLSGVHISQDGAIISSFSTHAHPTEIVKVNPQSGDLKWITKRNNERLEAMNFGKTEEHWVTTTDGKKMQVWVTLPPDFDPNKKYPALLYCQGGPQAAISQYFSFRWNFQAMAAQGYVVIAPNRRGLPGFGREWNDAISQDWGGQAIRDYLKASDSISALPYIDENRLGAVGASYGGYSVYFLAGLHEGRFKTFISHAGLFNLESWYGSTEEMFFANWDIGGAYWDENPPESYSKFSPHRFAQNWDTPILVIHGQKDYRVPVSQGMEAFNAAQLQGVQSKFLYFPDENHWILKPQNNVLWHREFFDWLGTYLK
ncbi:MAG: S9 family peptidase [Cyclobacteriaceae bacterium]|nr:S9 family peptidase [Cyclobacteriaceae bacterium]MCH8516526.1 S9 family peptidase [Cyclobacteriaceae bacterium]